MQAPLLSARAKIPGGKGRGVGGGGGGGLHLWKPLHVDCCTRISILEGMGSIDVRTHLGEGCSSFPKAFRWKAHAFRHDTLAQLLQLAQRLLRRRQLHRQLLGRPQHQPQQLPALAPGHGLPGPLGGDLYWTIACNAGGLSRCIIRSMIECTQYGELHLLSSQAAGAPPAVGNGLG